jgi:hypothetical protein
MYTNDVAINIDANVAAIIPTHIVNAKCFIIPVPKMNIDITTNNVEKDVHTDLFIVCRILSSNTFP